GQGGADLVIGGRLEQGVVALGDVADPGAGEAVGLQLDPHGAGLLALPRLLGGLQRPGVVLDVVAVLVREDVKLPERAAVGAELPLELAEEAGVEVDLLVEGAVEGTDRAAGLAALGVDPAGEEDGR